MAEPQTTHLQVLNMTRERTDKQPITPVEPNSLSNAVKRGEEMLERVKEKHIDRDIKEATEFVKEKLEEKRNSDK